MGKFKPLFYQVLVFCTIIWVAMLLIDGLENGNGVNDVKTIDGGSYIFLVLIAALAELLAFLIFRFFNKLINYVNNIGLALLVSIFSPVMIIAALMMIHKS